MIEIIINNIILAAVGIGIFGLAWASNFVFSMFYNIKVIKEEFNRERLIEGFLKLVTIILGTLLLVISITIIPLFIEKSGIQIDDELIQVINISVILISYLTSAVFYIKQSIETLKNILTVNQEEQDGGVHN